MKKIILILLGVVSFFVGNKLEKSNRTAELKDKIDYYKERCENAVETTGYLHPEYKEISKGRLIKLYEYKYDYYVEGEKFTKETSSNIQPSANSFPVFYMKNNLTEVDRINPCNTYKEAKNDNSSKPLQYLGIFLQILGVILGLSGIKSLFSVKKSN